MTIHKVLGIIQEYFSSRESMYHWLFWIRSTQYCGLNTDILLEEAAFHCLDNKQFYAAIRLFTLLYGVEYWKVEESVGLHTLLHKDITYPIWYQGHKWYIPELDGINYDYMADEDLPF